MYDIVVITYNSEEVIGDCLRACTSLNEARTTVVDNASSDRTVEVARSFGVALVPNASNLGFAAAANLGIERAQSDAVLILNPDVVPLSGVQALAKAVEKLPFAAAGGKLLGQDGLPQAGFNVRAFPTGWTLLFEIMGINRLFPGNRVNRAYRLAIDPDWQREVDQPAGAFLMVNRSAWQRIGGFDEAFFPIWFEDVDYCKRLYGAGYKCVYVPEAIARHHGGHSAKALSWASRQKFWYGSLLRYASKHFSGSVQASLSIMVVLVGMPRMVIGFTVTRNLEPVGAYLEIVRLAGRYLRPKMRGVPQTTVSSEIGKQSARF